jgi:hypothetical protein
MKKYPGVTAALILLLLAGATGAGALERLKPFEKQFHGKAVADAAGAIAEHDGDNSSGQILALLLAIPFAYSLDLGNDGYARWPYADGAIGDEGDRSYSLRLESYYHRVGDGIGGAGGRWRLDTEKHVGLEVLWTHYRERGEEDLNHITASAHGDLYRDERWRGGYQLGLGTLSGRLTRLGPRLALEGEGYPLKPFFVDAHAGASFIDNGPLGELRAGGGVSWRAFQVRVGYRALIGPFKTLDGPDAGLTVRF